MSDRADRGPDPGRDPADHGRDPDRDDPELAEPDVRFLYANERTFLAYNRTSLALVTAGLAVTQLLPPFDFPGGRRMIGLPLIAMGTVMSIASLFQWKRNEQAMRRGQPLPRSILPVLVTIVVAVSALVALALAIFAAAEPT